MVTAGPFRIQYSYFRIYGVSFRESVWTLRLWLALGRRRMAAKTTRERFSNAVTRGTRSLRTLSGRVGNSIATVSQLSSIASGTV